MSDIHIWDINKGICSINDNFCEQMDPDHFANVEEFKAADEGTV